MLQKTERDEVALSVLGLEYILMLFHYKFQNSLAPIVPLALVVLSLVSISCPLKKAPIKINVWTPPDVICVSQYRILRLLIQYIFFKS